MREVTQTGFYLYRMKPELLGNATLLYVGKNARGVLCLGTARLVCRANKRARFYGPVPMDEGVE